MKQARLDEEEEAAEFEKAQTLRYARYSLATPGGRVMISNPVSACQVFVFGTPLGTGTTIPACH